MITVDDFFMYDHMLENNLDFLISGFVLIGTDVIAVLFHPA
jgi:hypothetical protein